MKTIWSYVIWEKLGLKDYDITSESSEQSEKLIFDYMESLTLAELNEMLEDLSWVKIEPNTDLSWVKIEPNTDYYDGPFHEIRQGEESSSMIKIHDSAVVPFIMQMANRLDLTEDAITMVIKVLEIYRKKLPENENIVN
jgi:hypothetical protein